MTEPVYTRYTGFPCRLKNADDTSNLDNTMLEPTNATTWRLIIEHKAIGPNGAEAIMGRSKDLAKLLDRLEITNEFDWFYRQGWRNARLQDNSISDAGYTDTLREHLWSLYRLKQIDRNTYMRAIAYAC